MVKKGIKGLVLVLLLLTLFGCSSEKVKIIKDSSEIKPGTLTKENVSLAGIHIGDSQEQVLKLYGEPTKKEMVHSTPFLEWYYDDLGLLAVQELKYTESPDTLKHPTGRTLYMLYDSRTLFDPGCSPESLKPGAIIQSTASGCPPDELLVHGISIYTPPPPGGWRKESPSSE